MAATNSTDSLNSTENDSTSNGDSVSTSAPKIAFLLVFMLVGTFGNLILVITIGGHKRHRGSALHLFMLNLALVNCLDCFINMSFTLGSTVSSSWEITGFVCKLNAFFVNLVWIETLLGVMFMALDRMMATKHLNKYDQIQSLQRIIIMIVYSWVQSFFFSLPILVGAVPMKVYPDIDICIVSEKTSLVYTCILSLGCFLIPIILTTCFFIIICKTSYKERSNIRMKITQQYYSKDIEKPKLYKEIKGAQFASILFFAWVLMQVPFIVATFIHLFRYSEDLNSSSDQDIYYTWYISISLLWVKFGYVMVLPIAALIWKKELWQNFKDLILCRKSNMIVDVNGKEDPENYKIKIEKFKTTEGKDDKMKEAFVHNSGFQVPVLFATANGVHIQTYEADETESDMLNEHVGIRSKKCDVKGSHGQPLEDDTSDYDSSNELDPFSVSHPISAKNIGDLQNSLRQRSSSQPEVRDNKTMTRQNKGSTQCSITTTSAVDSGLDISTGKVNSTSNNPNSESNSFNHNITSVHNPHLENNLQTSSERLQNGKILNDENAINDLKKVPVGLSAMNTQHLNDQTSEQAVMENKNNTTGNLQILSAKSLVTPSPKSKRKKKKQNKDIDSSAINDADGITQSPQKLPLRLEPLPKLLGVSVIGGQLDLHADSGNVATETRKGEPGKKYRKLPSLSQNDACEHISSGKNDNTGDFYKDSKSIPHRETLLDPSETSNFPSLKVNLSLIQSQTTENGEIATPVTPSACDLMDIGRGLNEAASMSQSKESLVEKDT